MVRKTLQGAGCKSLKHSDDNAMPAVSQLRGQSKSENWLRRDPCRAKAKAKVHSILMQQSHEESDDAVLH